MDTSGTSFLFKCDREFNILHTFWYHPVHLLSPYQKTLTVYGSDEAEREDIFLKTIGKKQQFRSHLLILFTSLRRTF